MGTKGMIGIQVEGKLKVGYSNNSDSYPTWLGVRVIDFVKKLAADDNKQKFIDHILKMKCKIWNKKVSKKWFKYYVESYNLNPDDFKDPKFFNWGNLIGHIGEGEEILNEVLNGKLFHFIEGRYFIKDSLFCEFAYIINLDENTIEFYKGFQTDSDKSNKFGKRKNIDGYYPCKMVGKLPISTNINVENMLEFFPDEKGFK